MTRTIPRTIPSLFPYKKIMKLMGTKETKNGSSFSNLELVRPNQAAIGTFFSKYALGFYVEPLNVAPEGRPTTY